MSKLYDEYVTRIPRSNLSKLDRELDYDHRGVDLHLSQIADSMLNWESLAPLLKLTDVEMEDITYSNRDPALQRLVCRHIITIQYLIN